MVSFQKHLRNTFLAGIFSAVPLAVTIFIIWWVEIHTRPISQFLFHRPIPVVGVLMAIGAIYVAGLVTTTLLGKWFLSIIDAVLLRLPIIRQIYLGWKQIALTPGGTEGVFSKVALIPNESGRTLMLGFTSARPVEAHPDILCVFVPSCPNPLMGRLYLVRRELCQLVDLSTEEAFKIILSTGNYVPAPLGDAAEELFKSDIALELLHPEIPTATQPLRKAQ
jgi:uncharacterized membrane protein